MNQPTPPLRDEWAGELAQAAEDAADDVAEALDEAREVADCGHVEAWREEAGAVADDEAIQPSNASAGGFRQAPDGGGS